MTDFCRFLALGMWLLALGGLDSPAAAQAEGTVSANKGAIAVKTLTESNGMLLQTPGSFLNLANTAITIPSGQTGRVLASFSGEAICEGPGGWCSVRILVDGIEMFPQAGGNFAFLSPDVSPGFPPAESKSIDRVSQELPAGNHTVVLQWAAVSGATRFWLDDWQLKLAVWRIS
jgi:hypothetical protein